ncbi:MAG: pentapeptide repeat-containing protein [Symploca sp. SIO1C2]|nr:pentapeptide repeat-containing protein [Symploca sp. SIO1C2]
MNNTEAYQELELIIEQVLNAPTDDFAELATKAELALVDDLAGANLREVDLSSVDLRGADLRRADLRGAILTQTNLTDAKVEKALFGNNLGLSEATKQELEKLGAIFEELQQSNLTWLTHLRQILQPLSLPDQILAQLLDSCQEAAQSSLLVGAKLLYAVEGLFPNQSKTLNQLAQRVILGYPRSSKVDPQAEAQCPPSYHTATSTQKMVLSLSAAQQIIEALTLEVSPQQPRVEQEWLTTAGWLTLQIEYLTHQQPPKLQIQGNLPCGGSLQLQGGEDTKVVQSSEPGSLSIEWLNPYPKQKYTLAVYFRSLEQKPLVFTICTN